MESTEQEFKNLRRDVHMTSEFFQGANGTLHGERTFIPTGGNPKNPITLEDVQVKLSYPIECGEHPELTITITNLSGLVLNVVHVQEVIPLVHEENVTDSDSGDEVVSLTA